MQVPRSYGVAEDADATYGPYEHFSDASREILISAHEEAARLGHRGVGDEHLVIALARVAEEAPAESALRQTFAEFGIAALHASKSSIGLYVLKQCGMPDRADSTPQKRSG